MKVNFNHTLIKIKNRRLAILRCFIKVAKFFSWHTLQEWLYFQICILGMQF